jgi:hypothetical protein
VWRRLRDQHKDVFFESAPSRPLLVLSDRLRHCIALLWTSSRGFVGKMSGELVPGLLARHQGRPNCARRVKTSVPSATFLSILVFRLGSATMISPVFASGYVLLDYVILEVRVISHAGRDRLLYIKTLKSRTAFTMFMLVRRLLAFVV